MIQGRMCGEKMIKQRPYRGETDKLLMLEVAHFSSQQATHIVDLPYRLSSEALDNPENVGLWEDEAGNLLAWVVFQFSWWMVDYAFDERYCTTELEAQVLNWVDDRAKQWLLTPQSRPRWFFNVYDTQLSLIDRLEQLGFQSQENVPVNPWSKVFLKLTKPLPEIGQLPEGFTIRPLKGRAELGAAVALHQAAFESTNMNLAWRERILNAPHYYPEHDLVVEAPGGRLAAFCLCWFDAVGIEGQPTGQIEPMGVDPEFRKLGLGRNVLLAGLHSLKQAGATSLIVETDDYRNPAYTLYRSVGFELVQKVLIYRKDYSD